MANPVIRGFRNLTRFSGRDTRAQFWPYAGIIVALSMVAIVGAMGWMMTGVLADMQAFVAEHPEAATVRSSPGSYSVTIHDPNAPLPDIGPFFTVVQMIAICVIALLASAVSRRLHDRGKSALWGLAPAPFLLFGSFAIPALVANFSTSPEPNMGLFVATFANNLIYMVALVTLVIKLLAPGTSGPNRHGPEGQP